MQKRKFPSSTTSLQTWARQRNWCKGQVTLIRNMTSSKIFREKLTQEEQYIVDKIYNSSKELLNTWTQNNKESKENFLAEKE